MMLNRRGIFIKAIWPCIGMPYIWGGQNPTIGFDCSGLVLYGLHEAGIPMPFKDTNAQGLYNWLKSKTVPDSKYKCGNLFFYGNSLNQISHVMVLLHIWKNGTFVLCGARGGDSTTTTADKAEKQKAFVDVCFGDYWYSKLQAVCDPF